MMDAQVRSLDQHNRQSLVSRQSLQKWSRWRGLQARMTISYVWMTVLLVLLVVILAGLLLTFVINNWSEEADFSLAQKTGMQYAFLFAAPAPGSSSCPGAPGNVYLCKKATRDVLYHCDSLGQKRQAYWCALYAGPGSAG